jgi:hypothetical protein
MIEKELQTPEEWLACARPHQMYRLLEGRTSDRKAHLFASACLRRLWHWPGLAEHRWAVEVLERYADGAATPEQVRAAAVALRAAREAATWVMGGVWNQFFDELEERHTQALPTAAITCQAMSIAAGRLARTAAGLEDGRPEDEQRAPEQRAQCDLLRCIFGNPFAAAPHIDPSWLVWNGGTVKRLAESAYEERLLPSGMLDTARLTVLADALEEAGCASEEILGHLREQGKVHVRGCFVLDLLLKKE